MGVTLERVQNKFACIIGELCNEPYVLSQFAIWVDLRIAEYKANGAISLDCTGSAPEPTWLKGMKPPFTAQSDPLSLHQSSPGSSNRNGRQRHQGFGSSQPWSLSEVSHNPTSDTKLSNDFEIVEVKEEPQEFSSSVFTPHRSSRKRNPMDQNQDFLKSENIIFPTKIRRLSSASESAFTTPAQDSSTHQSFMSVIGISDQPSTSTDDENIVQAQNTSLSEYQKSRENISTDYIYDNQLNAPSSVSSDSDPFGATSCVSKSLPGMSSSAYGTLQGVPLLTIRNTANAASKFHNWLQSKPREENRLIQNIPPDELDEYLTVFFTTAKKSTGEDYHRHTLKTLRSFLERHLRVNGYPLSIMKSKEFIRSRNAYKLRLLQQ